MQGTRRPDGTQAHELAAGEYALGTGEPRSVWLCSPEGVAGRVVEPTWTITEEDDGTITVSPSIWWNKPEGWHGFLDHGIWREA